VEEMKRIKGKLVIVNKETQSDLKTLRRMRKEVFRMKKRIERLKGGE
jgi:hypothetical protein